MGNQRSRVAATGGERMHPGVAPKSRFLASLGMTKR